MVQFASDAKKKITILGAGTAACLTALHFGFNSWAMPNVEVELIHNPDVVPEKVEQAWTEGTLLDTPRYLWKSLGFNLMENELDATIKMGVMYEGWGKKNEMVPSPFPPNNIALHIDPNKLRDYILKSDWFKVKEEDVDNLKYDAIDSEYIIDCRGNPKSTKEDLSTDLYHVYDSHVNSVILASKPGTDLRQHWTKAVATPDGWCFEIPSGDNTTSYGYLYDHRVTTEEKAKANMQTQFNIQLPVSMGPSNNIFQFEQYLAKEPIIDDRVILSGNNLFFTEPLESVSYMLTYTWNIYLWDWFLHGIITAKQARKKIQRLIEQAINYVSWHYTFGSKYSTPFWGKAKLDSIRKFANDGDVRLRHVIKMATELDEKEIKHKILQQNLWDHDYGQWDINNFKFWLNGMTKKLPDHQRYPYI